jgi:L-threonylcarbamoyladenylate synthase
MNWQIQQAARVVRHGGIVAYPTEAVYGLGCNPLQLETVVRLLALKNRPASKGLILIAASWDQLEPYLLPLDVALRKRVDATWPGPVTWLLPARAEVPRVLRGEHDTLAVRITAHPLAAALCRAAGSALVSTSANRAGRPPARTSLQVRAAFGNALDFVLCGPTATRGRPTEIRDGRTGAIVRPG